MEFAAAGEATIHGQHLGIRRRSASYPIGAAFHTPAATVGRWRSHRLVSIILVSIITVSRRRPRQRHRCPSNRSSGETPLRYWPYGSIAGYR
jgi:hypothetical protein